MNAPGPLALVRWYDPTDLGGGWKLTADAVKDEPQVCTTVGWIIRDDDIVTVAASYSTDTEGTVHVGTGMTYPAACEIERTWLDGVD